MANIGKRTPLTIPPGTNPNPDTTDQSGISWLSTTGARFLNDGRMRAIEDNEAITYVASGGYSGSDSLALDLLGYASFVYSYTSGSSNELTLIGTHKRLYLLKNIQDAAPNVRLYNITPVLASTTAIANSIDTDYRTLGSDPITTTNTSSTVVVADAGHDYKVGDKIKIAGCTDTGGITGAQLDQTHATITAITTNTWSYVSSGTATSSATGGGASVVVSSGLLTIAATSNGLTNDDRVKVASAADTGGITAVWINMEHIIRNKQTNSFQIMAGNKATSSVSGGGGASTTYQKPIITASNPASSILNYSVAPYGSNMIINMSGSIYTWGNSELVAPVLTSNAPSASYIFESNSQVCTLNQRTFKTSDIGDSTEWTPSDTTLAFEDDKEGISLFKSHAKSGEIDLLFTENEVIAARYVGLPKIWDLSDIIMSSDGIISQNSRIEVDNNIFWMGKNNFYIFDGANASIIPNNTLQEYVFKRIHMSHKSRIFGFHVPHWGEVGWMIPLSEDFGGETEENGLTFFTVMYNYKIGVWTLDSGVNRTCAEQFKQGNLYPIMVDGRYSINDSTQIATTTYRHAKENTVRGLDVYTPFQKVGDGDDTFEIITAYPDFVLSGGTVKVTYKTKEEAQDSTVRTTELDGITSTDKQIEPRAEGRYRQIRIQTNSGVTDFVMGKIYEEINAGTSR